MRVALEVWPQTTTPQVGWALKSEAASDADADVTMEAVTSVDGDEGGDSRENQLRISLASQQATGHQIQKVLQPNRLESSLKMAGSRPDQQGPMKQLQTKIWANRATMKAWRVTWPKMEGDAGAAETATGATTCPPTDWKRAWTMTTKWAIENDVAAQ